MKEADNKIEQLRKEVGELRNSVTTKSLEINKTMSDVYDVQEGEMTVARMIRLIRRVTLLTLYEEGLIKEMPIKEGVPESEKQTKQ